MKLTQSQLKQIIKEEIEQAWKDEDVFSAMEYIFVNAMDGSPIFAGDMDDLFVIPAEYYVVDKDNKVYPTKAGVAYLKAKGLEVEKY